MDDLWPVIVGGGLALVGTLLGGIVSERVRDGTDKKKKRPEKLEELVATLYDHKHWLERKRSERVFGSGTIESYSPIAKAEAIATVYFPNFLSKLQKLEAAADVYEVEMLEAAKERIAGKLPNTSKLGDLHMNYFKELKEATKEIRDYAKTEAIT